MASILDEFDELEQRLQYECNRALVRFLRGFQRELVSLEGEPWVQFTHPTWRRPHYSQWRRRFYLPAQPAKAVQPWFPYSEEMREFYQFFDGLREEPPGDMGDFSPAAEAPKLGDQFGEEDYPEFVEYRDLPIIFFAANGDALVKTHQEKFMWCQLEDHEMRECAESFPGLLEAWIAHHAVGDGIPFSSYGRD